MKCYICQPLAIVDIEKYWRLNGVLWYIQYCTSCHFTDHFQKTPYEICLRDGSRTVATILLFPRQLSDPKEYYYWFWKLLRRQKKKKINRITFPLSSPKLYPLVCPRYSQSLFCSKASLKLVKAISFLQNCLQLRSYHLFYHFNKAWPDRDQYTNTIL